MHDPVESAINHESDKQEAWERELMEIHGTERTAASGLTAEEATAHRNTLGLTTAQLAQTCGTSLATAYNWEKIGVKGPAAKLIELLVRLHNLKESYTFGDTDSPKAR